MTEDEAKTKWCPMTRHGYGSEGVGINRMHNNKQPETARCIGSDCMMWRKGGISYAADREYSEQELEVIYSHGYCGLAGKP